MATVAALKERAESLDALMQAARNYIPGAKVHALGFKLLGSLDINSADQSVVGKMLVMAMNYALDIMIFSPSMTGKTALHRVLQNMPCSPAQKADVQAMLGAATLRLVRLPDVVKKNTVCTAEFLPSGEKLSLWVDNIVSGLGGSILVMRLVHAEGVYFPIGFPVELSSDNLVLTLGSWPAAASPSVNFKEARHFAETLCSLALQISFESLMGEDDDDDEGGLLDVMAVAWAKRSQLAEPTAQEMETIREAAVPEVVEDVLYQAFKAERDRKFSLLAAYERILSLQLETIHRRTMAGIRVHHESIDTIKAELLHQINIGAVPSSVMVRFEAAANRARAAIAAENSHKKSSSDELDKVVVRIKALRSKTVEQGCTEEEAMLAAKKVAELLDRYGLSLNESSFKEQTCTGQGIDTGRKRLGALDATLSVVAEFCDCRTWYEVKADGTHRHIIFGLPADVEAAHYLYERVCAAFETETKSFKKSTLYLKGDQGHRRSATTSFQDGLCSGINSKLRALRKNRTLKSSSGTDLVLLKKTAVEEEMERLGLTLTTKAVTGRRSLNAAYAVGYQQGEALEWTEQLETLG
jgi:hypothetical protein